MNNSKSLLNLKTKTNKLKNPKLDELYTYLFNKTPDHLHNSLYDTRYTAECYFELEKLKKLI
jgi:hypothetical protein